MKKCIFHIPYRLSEDAMSAPMLRPRMMIEAFKKNGYEVSVVSGSSNERVKIIKEILQQIDDGVKYDFAYAENSSVATIFTDVDHIPRHPFCDHYFFYRLKKRGIKIGLFYRDIYWKFDMYRKDMMWIKYILGIVGYKYDLLVYKQLLDKFYVPTYKLYEYIRDVQMENKLELLPPGCIEEKCMVTNTNQGIADKKGLTIFYVGGISGHYNLTELFKAVQKCEFCKLIVCCREKEWISEKVNYQDYMCERIEIIHKTNTELLPYYCEADICSLLFANHQYMELAIPYKTFEYLSYGKPMLVTRGTAIGEFVEKNNIGWIMDFQEKEIVNMLNKIIENPVCLREKQINCKNIIDENTWCARAKQVIKGLTE